MFVNAFFPINFLKFIGDVPKPGLTIEMFSLEKISPFFMFLVVKIDLLKIKLFFSDFVIP